MWVFPDRLDGRLNGRKSALGPVPPPQTPLPPFPCLARALPSPQLRPKQGTGPLLTSYPFCPLPSPSPSSLEGCEYLGETYLSSQEFPDPREPCNLCTCLGGFVTCGRRPCEPLGCSHPLTPAGHCCPTCQGRTAPALPAPSGAPRGPVTRPCHHHPCPERATRQTHMLCSPQTTPVPSCLSLLFPKTHGCAHQITGPRASRTSCS